MWPAEMVGRVAAAMVDMQLLAEAERPVKETLE
jgi:hypothetical protein